MDFKKLMMSKEYDFLRTHERLGKRIILLGLGGSYSYGTNNENSDIDFRGITLQMSSDLLGLTSFEQYEDSATDTVLYCTDLTKSSNFFWSVIPTQWKCWGWMRNNI